MSDFRIRDYASGDRPAVREIAFETGYMGDPIGWLWPDREGFADVITRYYTDREPESILVIERKGVVAGYLTGCVDSQRTHDAAAKEVRRLLGRGALFRPGAAGFLWRSILDFLRDGGAPEEVLLDHRWPAHLHIDLLPEARGRGLGRRLMKCWFERLRAGGCPGLHLGTFAENTGAIGFFESCGLARHGVPTRVPGFRTREGARMHAQWMVRRL